jgi:hypothetical protein
LNIPFIHRSIRFAPLPPPRVGVGVGVSSRIKREEMMDDE